MDKMKLFVHCKDKKFLIVVGKFCSVDKLSRKIELVYNECFKESVKVKSISFNEYVIPGKYLVLGVLQDSSTIHADLLLEDPAEPKPSEAKLTKKRRLGREREGNPRKQPKPGEEKKKKALKKTESPSDSDLEIFGPDGPPQPGTTPNLFRNS